MTSAGVKWCVVVCLLNIASGQKKALEKCKEYGALVYGEEVAPVMLPGAVVNKVSQCGIVEVPLIVGGEKTGAKEFPHMVVIGFGEEPDVKWMCGGTLINENYVLTAAHCMRSKEMGDANWVRVGDVNLDGKNEDANPQKFGVKERISHPDYKPPSKYNDIALLKIDGTVKFDAYTRPACLNTKPDVWTKTAIATGFGRIGYETDKTSKDLLKVNIHFIPKDSCQETFKNDVNGRSLKEGILASQLCAGEKEGGKDTCQGDSGGPLQTVLEEPYCMYSVLGVTSFGKFCGFSNSPAIYSRVSYYIPWIEGIVWP